MNVKGGIVVVWEGEVCGGDGRGCEGGVYGEVGVDRGGDGLVEREDLGWEGEGDYGGGFGRMGERGRGGLLRKDKRERRESM